MSSMNIQQPNQPVQGTPPLPDKNINTDKYKNYQPTVQFNIMTMVGLDLGYSTCKGFINNKFNTEPTAISFSIDTGIDYGDSYSYIFEEEDLYVGVNAVGDSFSSLDYKFKLKYDPILIFHNLLKMGALNISQKEQSHLTLCVGLALGDWKNKDEYINRIQEITVDGKTFTFPNIKIIPQGAGAYISFVINDNNNTHPDTCSVIDIGYNTINLLHFVDGKPQKQYCRSYMGHGVSTIIKSFSDYLENKFGMSFSEQEAIQIFLKEKFIYNGVPQLDIVDIIYELKNNFLKKLRNSVLVKEKKILSISEKVVFTGGGANLLKNIGFPPNVVFSENSIYSNVNGYIQS